MINIIIITNASDVEWLVGDVIDSVESCFQQKGR